MPVSTMKCSFQAPETYSEESTAFNCVMRAHLNYLENYPFFASTMLVGGIQYPVSNLNSIYLYLMESINNSMPCTL